MLQPCADPIHHAPVRTGAVQQDSCWSCQTDRKSRDIPQPRVGQQGGFHLSAVCSIFVREAAQSKRDRKPGATVLPGDSERDADRSPAWKDTPESHPAAEQPPADLTPWPFLLFLSQSRSLVTLSCLYIITKIVIFGKENFCALAVLLFHCRCGPEFMEPKG